MKTVLFQECLRGDDSKASEVAILLHGFLGSGRNLRSFGRSLAQSGRYQAVYLVDHLGHGRSLALPESPNIMHLAEAVWSMVADLKLGSDMHVIGHSLGGRVALAMRLCGPNTMFPLTLVDIAPGPMPHLRGDMQKVLAAFLTSPEFVQERGQMQEFLHAQGLATPLVQWLSLNLKRTDAGYGWAVDRKALACLHENSASIDLWEAVEGKERRGYTQCIRGGASDFVDNTSVERLTRLGAEVTTIAGAGHFVHIDALNALKDAVLHFRYR